MTIQSALPKGSLVLYKQKPARVREAGGKKLIIEVADGGTIKVRPKDVMLLHGGPFNDLSQLTPQIGEVKTAWEILQGHATNLQELAELAYEAYTVETAWAAWELIDDGLYFTGTPQEISVRTKEEVASEMAARQAKEEERLAWEAFLGRIEKGQIGEADGPFIEDIIALALEQREESRVLRALGQAETPQNAHALLLKLGVWDVTFNPYPLRAGVAIASADARLDELPHEERRDLTHLTALAIDDAGSEDPDDALSWENGRLWVHIADAAALIAHDSEADSEARARGANLYLPEGTVTMLPPAATEQLALGLADVSPALSFGLDLNSQGEIADFEIVPSLVRVTRLSYRDAEARLEEAPLRELLGVAEKYEARRFENGAIAIDLPEVKIRVHEGEIEIRPLPDLRSRTLVREAMLMAGEATGQYAERYELALPFTTQDAPTEELPAGDTPSAYFATRIMLRPGSKSTRPGRHAGLGMDLYVQATSPLRRYLDLVTHQQLRAHIGGRPALDSGSVLTLIGSAAGATRDVRTVERLSNRHWTLVYLMRHPDWRGEGIVVEQRGSRTTVLLPQLGMETGIYSRRDLPLDGRMELRLRDVDLVNLEANFQRI